MISFRGDLMSLFMKHCFLLERYDEKVEPPLVGGNKSLFALSGSHDQDGRHDHIS